MTHSYDGPFVLYLIYFSANSVSVQKYNFIKKLKNISLYFAEITYYEIGHRRVHVSAHGFKL